MNAQDGQSKTAIKVETKINNDLRRRLQKFTESHSLQKKKRIPIGYEMDQDCDAFILNILYGDRWTTERFHALTSLEKDKFGVNTEKALNTLAFEDRDRLIDRLEEIIVSDTKKSIWGNNHSTIIAALAHLTEELGRFPTRTEISKRTSLSRVTINKHLKEYFGSDDYNEKKEELIIMRELVLAKAFKYAVTQVDLRAMKIFLDATSEVSAGRQMIKNQQNNYIQVNGFVITEERMRNLPIEKLKKIHEMINE